MENGLGQDVSTSNGKLSSAFNKSKKYSESLETKKTTSSPSKPSHFETLCEHEVPDYSRAPFITSGYRYAENISIRQCIATLFTVHNESFNIWSHIIASLACVLYAFSVFSEHQIIGNASIYPLICFAICIFIAFSSSAFAHLFSCMSWKVRNACFYLDYLTISVFTFSAGQAYIFYSRPLSTDSSFLFKNPYIFQGISITMSALNMYLACLSRHRLRNYRFLIRTGTYVVKFFFDISPFISRCLISDSNCCSSTVILFKRQMLWYGISGVVNAARIPERFAPGFFDLFGHSHHIFHVLLTVANLDKFVLLADEMENRKVELLASPYQPTFFTTFGLLAILMIVDVAIWTWFVCNWLTTEQQELFGGGKYQVIYRKTDYEESKKTK